MQQSIISPSTARKGAPPLLDTRTILEQAPLAPLAMSLFSIDALLHMSSFYKIHCNLEGELQARPGFHFTPQHRLIDSFLSLS